MACTPGSDRAPRATAIEPETPAGSDPGARVVAVGTVQDGGLPHAACSCPRCEAARSAPERARRVASLAIVLPASRRVFLIDATPDVRAQLDAVREARGPLPGRVDRSPVDGVFLTHAHMGHYLGLAFFGYEAVHTRELPVYASPSMAELLRSNAPWDQLVRLGNVALREIASEQPVDLGDGVTVTPIAVPHRREYTDTLGYLLRGPRARVLYVPDTDSWRHWDPPLVERLQSVDVAILDGTFFSAGELPGRDVASIGHPLIVESMELLAPLVRDGRTRVYFTHLNHSNPALDPASEASRALEAAGFRVLAEGAAFPL